MDRKEIKERAKEFGFNNKWLIWKPILIVGLISAVINLVVGFLSGIFGIPDDSALNSLLTLLIELALLPMSVGLVSYLIQVVKGKKVDLKETLLSKYQKEYLWKIISTTILANLIIMAMSLLLVIPGIIYALKYAMITFLLAEATSKELESENIRQKSSELMDGYKWDYFVFQLSFFGWGLLCALTLGILYIWVLPYMQTAEIMYFEELKKIKSK